MDQVRAETLPRRYSLVVVSNRGPLSFLNTEDTLKPIRGSGGLISGLLAALPSRDAIWISAIAGTADMAAFKQGLFSVPGIDLAPVPIDHETYVGAYDRIANETLWFLYHGLFDMTYEPSFDDQFYVDFESYRRYNQVMSDEVALRAELNAVVLVNDYHLNLVPGMLREVRPDLTICFFVHTPFPSRSELRILPLQVRTELLESLTHSDSIGFHSERWRSNFLECLSETSLPTPRLLVEPLAIDLTELQERASRSDTQESARLLNTESGTRPLIVRVDRLELSKNLIRGFRAFERMLEEWPHTQSNCSFLALCYPSRTSIDRYRRYREEVEHVVKEINERFGTPHWTPITLKTDDNYARSLAALQNFDVLLVNPVRDGLNLVALEGLAINQRKGSVVLSEDAGAYELMGDLTFGVNPFDIVETSQALYSAAFEQTLSTKEERYRKAHNRLSQRTPQLWIEAVTLT